MHQTTGEQRIIFDIRPRVLEDICHAKGLEVPSDSNDRDRANYVAHAAVPA
jgi:hypothetical protein